MTGTDRQLAGIGEDGLHLYTCPLCEAMCGLEIEPNRGTSPASDRTGTTCGAAATSARKARRWAPCMTIPTGSARR